MKLAERVLLHNPAHLLIEAVDKLPPHTKQVAVFDTAFHQTMPDHAYTYAIPTCLYENTTSAVTVFTERATNLLPAKGANLQDWISIKPKSAGLPPGQRIFHYCRQRRQVHRHIHGFTSQGLVMGTRTATSTPPLLLSFRKKKVGQPHKPTIF